jgi:hypothetical protein
MAILLQLVGLRAVDEEIDQVVSRAVVTLVVVNLLALARLGQRIADGNGSY